MPEPLPIHDKPRFRKVPLRELRTGMYVCDLRADWLRHSFWRKQFLIKDEAMLARLQRESLREVIIDTGRGIDIAPVEIEPCRDDPQRFAELDRRLRDARQQRLEILRHEVSLDEERRRSQFFQRDALSTMHRLMAGIREDGRADIRSTGAMVEKIMRSVQRHPDALIPALQNKSDYPAQHALRVAALTLALGTALDLDKDILCQAAQGALLQDIGSLRTPGHILNKPGRLTAEETRLVRRHVLDSQLILEDSPGMTETMLDIVTHHHERLDGSGYPLARAGDDIPLHAQMAAIADVYDALTSARPHQPRTEPAEAVRLLYSLAGAHFQTDLLRAFVRTVGIYPVGSLLRLDSGHLAVVTEVHRDKLLRPRVLVMFDTRIDRYIQPYVLDLGRRSDPPAIVGVESYAARGIDPLRWLPG